MALFFDYILLRTLDIKWLIKQNLDTGYNKQIITWRLQSFSMYKRFKITASKKIHYKGNF